MSQAQYEIVDAADGGAKLRLTGDWTTTALGKVMGVVKTRLAGKADMGQVSAAVKAALAG